MKLRNIVLAVVATTCTSAFAASSMVNGGTYVGFAGGWGKVDYDTDTAAYFYPGYAADIKSGGFAGHAYVGYLIPLTAESGWALGPEIGYSFYPKNVYTVNVPSQYNSVTTETSSGIDLLLNITYAITNAVNIAVKPGIQYATQKDATSDYFNDASQLPASASNSKIAPEINLEINWQAFTNTPLFLGASYQYVYGDSAVGNFSRLWSQGSGYASVTSRDILALNVEYMFN